MNTFAPRSARVTALIGAVCVLSLSAQTPQTPVFRSGANLVPLTVTVLDRKGVPVTDLTASDFTVYENGRERQIVNFFRQELGPRVERASDPIPASPGGIAPARRRLFLIVLGFGRIQYPGKGVDGALSFVRERLLPDDAVAVTAFHRTTEFTTDHQAVAGILDRYRKQHEQMQFEIRRFYAATRSPYSRGGPPLPDSMLKRIDSEIFGRRAASPAGRTAGNLEIRNTADMLLGMDRATRVVDKPWQKQATFADLMSSLDRSAWHLTDAVIGSTRLKLFAGIEHLRDLEGEKHVVVVAQDGIARHADDAAMVARRAASARVTVNFVWTFGTAMSGTSGCLPCRDVADATGGYYTSLLTADKALAQVDQATRFTYLLGYEPSDPTLDGKPREVRVKVNRADVVVQFRRGYYAETAADPAEVAEWIRQSRVDAALSYDASATDVPLKLTTSSVASAAETKALRVEVTIDVSALALEMKAGLRSGRLEVQVHCGDVKQRVIGSVTQRVDLNLTPETFAKWSESGFKHVIVVPVSATPAYVKAVVYDYGSERVGSSVLTLKGSITAKW